MFSPDWNKAKQLGLGLKRLL